MFNLLKSDVYRLVHGKMFWVAAIVLVALSALAAGMMHWVSSPEFLRMTATSFEMTVNVSDGAPGGAGVLGEGDAGAANASAEAAAAAGASGRGLSLDELDTLGAAEAAGSAESEEDSMRDDETASDSAFASSELWDLVADNPEALSDADFEGVSRDMRTLASPADMLGDMAVSGGALAMVVSLVTALFLAQDFSMRFARNLVMDRRGRVRYYGEKLVLVGLLAAFYLELTTGLRRGELLALQWTDLDVENRTLSVTKQVNRINGKLVVSPPKTRNSIRTLALPQQAVDLLAAEHQKHPRNPYLFPSPKTGTMYDPDAFRRTHDKILKAIGAEHIRFHDLRHPYVKHTTKILACA